MTAGVLGARALCLAAAIALAGCTPKPRELEVGAHRVRLAPPRGWEHLDRGRAQIYSRGDARISLLDFGPAPDSVEAMVELARERTEYTDQREILRQSTRTIGAAEWIEVVTRDRITGANPRKLACLDDGGDLLVLSLDRGDMEREGRTFEALLGSLEILPKTGR
jgi:hypothetical protein